MRSSPATCTSLRMCIPSPPESNSLTRLVELAANVLCSHSIRRVVVRTTGDRYEESQMALQGPIPVEFGHVFAHGAYAAGGFEPMRDFDASSGDRFVQAKDKASGQPVWVIEVIDPDPAARDKTVKVKIAAVTQPVLPPASAGMPFVPV